MKKPFVISLLLGLLFLTACTLQIQAPPVPAAATKAPAAVAAGQAMTATKGMTSSVQTQESTALIGIDALCGASALSLRLIQKIKYP